MTHDLQLRQRIAQTSARLMIQEGINDYHIAKCKAAAQLGVLNKHHLPSNSEIEQEILLYQRLFQPHLHSLHLNRLRHTALQMMRLLNPFNPRLVGVVLEGTAHRNSEITLHLFTHTPEEVAFLLMEKHIPYQLSERRFRLPKIVSYPCYQFIAGEHSVLLIVFNIDDVRWSPPSPVDGKPMRRADLRVVENLLREHDSIS